MERDPRLEALADTRARIAEIELLLAELPGLFEARFRQRLQPLLDQQQRLLAENAELRQQILGRPRLLPLPGRRLRAVIGNTLRGDDDAPPTAASAGPTRR